MLTESGKLQHKELVSFSRLGDLRMNFAAMNKINRAIEEIIVKIEKALKLQIFD